MPLLFFLLVLAFPPLMVLVPTLAHPGDFASQGVPGLKMILMVEGVLLVGYGLSLLERRRLHGAHSAVGASRSAKVSGRSASARVLAGH